MNWVCSVVENFFRHKLKFSNPYIFETRTGNFWMVDIRINAWSTLFLNLQIKYGLFSALKSFIAKYFELKPKAGVCYKTLMFKIIPSVEENTKILKIISLLFKTYLKKKILFFISFPFFFVWCFSIILNYEGKYNKCQPTQKRMIKEMK